MKFVSVRDLRSQTAAVRKNLQTEQELVLTASGRPVAIMARVDEDNFEDRLKVLRRARAAELLGRIRCRARQRGADRLPMRQIDAIIAQSRRERRRGS